MQRYWMGERWIWISKMSIFPGVLIKKEGCKAFFFRQYI
jgi:hypothetical protein